MPCFFFESTDAEYEILWEGTIAQSSNESDQEMNVDNLYAHIAERSDGNEDECGEEMENTHVTQNFVMAPRHVYQSPVDEVSTQHLMQRRRSSTSKRKKSKNHSACFFYIYCVFIYTYLIILTLLLELIKSEMNEKVFIFLILHKNAVYFNEFQYVTQG